MKAFMILALTVVLVCWAAVYQIQRSIVAGKQLAVLVIIDQYDGQVQESGTARSGARVFFTEIFLDYKKCEAEDTRLSEALYFSKWRAVCITGIVR